MKRQMKFLFPTLLLLALALAGSGLVAQTITLTDGTNQCDATLTDLVITPETGKVTANVGTDSACLSGSASTPTINSFTLEGQSADITVDEGAPVQVAWNSSNAISCESGGTLPSWRQLATLQADGTFEASTSGLPNGNFTLQLSCTGDEGTANAPQRTVTIENSSSTDACATRPAPQALNRANSIVVNRSDNGSEFASVFRAPFPGSGSSEQIRIPDGQYAAIEFTTEDIASGALGEFSATILQPIPFQTATSPNVNRLWSISACPGDFRKTEIDSDQGPGCVQGGTDQSNFRIGGPEAFSEAGRCALDPNTTYFLNLLYTSEPPPTNEAEHGALEGECIETNCGNAIGLNQFGFQ